LFSGRYKAILVEKDSYAQILSAYIHLNPVRAKMAVKDPGEYQWSSCKYYFSEKEEPEFLETGIILGYFDRNRKRAQQKYVEYLKEQTTLKNDPFSEVRANAVLGNDKYLEWLKENAEKKGWIKRPVPAMQKLYDTRNIEKSVRERSCDMVGSVHYDSGRRYGDRHTLSIRIPGSKRRGHQMCERRYSQWDRVDPFFKNQPGIPGTHSGTDTELQSPCRHTFHSQRGACLLLYIQRQCNDQREHDVQDIHERRSNRVQ